VFVARDQIGVKPFYHAQTDRGVLFGSEIKALLCDESLARDVDPVALHETLAYLWTPAPRTMLSSVCKLPPGCAAVISGGRIVRHWCYYDVPYVGTRSDVSRAESAEALQKHLAAAVRRQLVSDVPIGAYLSGGLDSSAIVAMMVREHPDVRPTCFTIGVDAHADADGIPEDLPYARRVATHLGVKLVEVAMSPAEIRRLPEMMWMLDEPQADPAPIAAMMIAERARDMGIPVLMSGAGGDDLFSGYRRHAALTLEQFWSAVPAPIRSGARSLTDRVASHAGTGRAGIVTRRIAKMLAATHETGDRRLASFFLWSTEPLRRSLYAPEFKARLQEVDTLGPLLDSLSRIPGESDPLQRMLYLEMKHFLADHNLNYTDRAGMATGVEVRVPLLDLDLVRFATGVPSRFKQRGRTGKAIFKQAMEPYLPREVIYRPKTGFGAPLKRWLNVELRDMVDDVLSLDRVRRRGFFEPQAVKKLVADVRADRVDAGYTVFALMCFELWLQGVSNSSVRLNARGQGPEVVTKHVS
jgi:asparagine synthase (glutamine-hydrolysing)